MFKDISIFLTPISSLWAVIWKEIQYSLQWLWFYPNWMVGSKVGFRSLEVNYWSNLIKIFDNPEFDLKTWKISFCWSFDQFWPSINYRLIGAFWLQTALRVLWYPYGLKSWWSRHSHDPPMSKWFFWNFRCLTWKLKADKIWYQQQVQRILLYFEVPTYNITYWSIRKLNSNP